MKNITYISASAGSGKTYELTERLKKVIIKSIRSKQKEIENRKRLVKSY